MLGKVTPILVSVFVLVAPACKGGGDGGGGGAGGAGAGGSGAGGSGGQGGTSSTSVVCQGASVTANEVQPNTPLTFDWSGLSKDFLGNGLDPKKDIGIVSLIPWSLTVDQVQTKMDTEDLDNQYIISNVPLSLKTDANLTSTKLFDLTLNGGTIGDGGTLSESQVLSYFDPSKWDPASNSYTFLVASGTTPGKGSKMIQSFVLDPSSTNTNVSVTNTSTQLQFTAVLDKLAPTGVTGGTGSITIDWNKLATSAMGRSFFPTDIDRVIVGHYTQTPVQLQSNDTFLRIESIATALYSKELDTTTTKLDLSTLTDSSNNAFPGIDGTGTWIVALQCLNNCRNPAPLYLAILKPCN